MNQYLINRVFEGFNGLKAVVIGDVMIDSYYNGDANRISPEAPVPVVSVTGREDRPGGAANVARNLTALGAEPFLCSYVGDDDKAESFIDLIEDAGLSSEGILKHEGRVTTSKTRIISRQQQLLRVDEEQTESIKRPFTQKLFERIKEIIESRHIDVLIFEDYDKGLITKPLIQQVVLLCREKGIPVAADPKERNFWAYRNVSLFKPNLKELAEGLKLRSKDLNKLQLDAAFDKLKSEMNIDTALVTLSEKGMYLNYTDDSVIIPAHFRNISDVSGAGDTVISVMALCMALGVEPETGARLANLAGGLVCEEVGVVPVNKQVLLEEALSISN